MILSEEIKSRIYAEAERTYPDEGCGVVLGVVSAGREAKEFVALQNKQNEMHARDPKRYPRDAKTAYMIDPKEWQQIENQARSKGMEIISIFHSHPEHGVYFSDEDKGMAAPWGEPLFPNQSYMVVSVYGGQVKNASEFVWNSEKKDFIEQVIL